VAARLGEQSPHRGAELVTARRKGDQRWTRRQLGPSGPKEASLAPNVKYPLTG
jgi:hypothetical protein